LQNEATLVGLIINEDKTKYSETCLSWPLTVPETVVNLHQCVPK
jgi:hypothetical protein